MFSRLVKVIVSLFVCLVFAFSVSSFASAKTTGGGPIVLMGIDAEDGGVNGHGPISVYQNIVKSILAKVTNGGSGILVIGGGGAPSNVTEFWNNVANGIGQKVTFVSGSTNIAKQSFTGFAMIAVASDVTNTPWGGLTEEEHNSLVGRKNDIAAFVNNGGGILGFSSDFPNPYAYMGAIANFSVVTGQGYDAILPNSDGLAIGITSQLNVCCWHDEFSNYPSFLKPLATYLNSNGAVAAIGGDIIRLTPTLTVSPSVVSIAIGKTIPLTVTLTDSNGNVQDVTSATAGTLYSSDNPDILVDPNGVISLAPTAQVGETGTITIANNGQTATVQVKVDPAVKIISLSTANTVTLGPGESQQLIVTAEYSDGTKKDVTYAVDGTTYTSADEGIAAVSPNGLITIGSNANYGDSTTITVKNQDVTTAVLVKVGEPPVSLTVTPANVQLAPGETQQLTVVANFADGTKKDVTNSVKYMSGDTSLAIVDTKGLISIPNGASNGRVVITSSYAGLKAETTVNVEKRVASLTVSPGAVALKPGNSQQLVATATYTDGTTEDVTNKSIYKTNNSNLVSVNANGVLTVPKTASGGTATIEVSYGGKSAVVNVTVPYLTGISIEPKSVQLKPGQTQQVKAIAVYSDGSTQDVTNEASFSSSDTSLATVDGNGLVTIPNTARGGTVYIRGNYGGKGGAATFTIPQPPVVSGLAFTPGQLTLRQGESTQVKVIATYSDGTTEDVTAKANLSSSDTNQVVVDPATGTVHVLDSAAGGTVYIRGNYGGKGGAVTLTIPALPTVVSLTLTPASKTVKPGDTVQMQVIANYSDGTQKDVTSQASLKSSNTSLATVEVATGLVTIPTDAYNGSVNIQASYGGKGGVATLTVSKPYIVGIAFTPDKVTLKAGNTLAMKVVATYSDGTTEDVTAQTTFSSSNTSLATVDSNGVVTIPNSTSGGTVYIRGTYSGKGAASTVTVLGPPTVAKLIFTPSTATLKNGETLQINVIAEYSDGTKEDVTSKVVYSSSNTSLATVDVNGLVTIPNTASGGTVYIRGSYNGKGGSVTITVPTKPPVVSLTFTPATLSLNKGDTYQVKVIATYSDGTTEDVTAFTTFSSSNANVATVDAKGLITVPLNSLGGTVYIRGTYNGKGGATTVTVK